MLRSAEGETTIRELGQQAAAYASSAWEWLLSLTVNELLGAAVGIVALVGFVFAIGVGAQILCVIGERIRDWWEYLVERGRDSER